jgi:capsular polysaccharide biosynthesis protein
MIYKSEMCGVAGGINCLISDLILQAVSSSSLLSSYETKFYGLESNDEYTRSMHPNFEGEHPRRKNWSPLNITQNLDNKNYKRMQQEADAVFIVSRNECDHRGINKMWVDYIDAFPADKWHADVLAGLEKSANREVATQPKVDKIVVGYVDRQNTGRNMPPSEHEWLVGFLTNHPMIDFLHLHMEDYTALEQIRVASECHVLIGVHGNGLSHSLWMQPERYVVEIFWQFRFQFDYMTAAQLMRHNYLALFNGKAIDQELIQTRSKSLRKMPKKIVVTQQNFTKFTEEVEEGRQALMGFLQKAMIEFGVR